MGRERAERRGGVGVATAMCVLVASLVIWSPPAQAQVASRAGAEAKAAAPLTLKVVHSVDRKLRGNFNGVGPVWEGFSSPALADLDADRVPEIVFATVDGIVAAVRATDRRQLWRRDLGSTAVQASPAVKQMRGSNAPEVVVATMDGRVLMLDGRTGATLLTLRQGPPLYCAGGADCRPDGFFGTPALADVDGDGSPDIVASSYDHTIYAWTASGRLIFRYFVEDTVWSSPVVRDIDKDGRAEVIVGGDIYAGNNLGAPKGGLVWVLSRRSGSWRPYPGYPKSIPGQTVWSTPAVGDLNGDGNLDIVVGTGNNFAVSAASQRLYAFTARTAQNLPGWPIATTGQVSNGPAIVDLDKDGRNEVAFASEGPRVGVRNRTGSARWTACAKTSGACAPSGGTHGAPAVADLDGDGIQEVIAALDRDLVAYDGRTGKVKAKVTFAPAGSIASSGTPTVGSVNGKATIVVMVTAKTGGGGPPAAGDTQRVFSLTTGRPLGAAAWPVFKRTSARTG